MKAFPDILSESATISEIFTSEAFASVKLISKVDIIASFLLFRFNLTIP